LAVRPVHAGGHQLRLGVEPPGTVGRRGRQRL